MHGVKYTCLFALVGTIIGLFIGLILGGIRTMEINRNDKAFVKVLKYIAQMLTRFYVWVFRGTPLMVQAIFLYYLLKPVIHWTSFQAGFAIVSLNTGAYMSEIIRSGIQSIDKGQLDACKSIGLTYLQSLTLVIMPQAIKNAFPAIGNEFVVNIKDTSILNVLSITELYFQTASIAGSNYRYIETFLVSAIIYLFLTTVATTILNFVERKIAAGN